uniref:Uncharacterized LOC107749227 n=1 Tax=Sinocyclocheilus rhinocerous TaxID=307959 RepID=A0A673KUQ2_9TELE
MPVAIRKRSWEDHVTPRTGLQYSYDDLDLVCCHVRYQRSRCASMPECSHHQPRTLLCPQEDIRDGRRTMERIEDDGIFKCSDHEMLKIGSLKPPACETSQLEPSGKIDILETRLDCFSKLQTIHEGSFPESGDDASAQILAEMPEHLSSREEREKERSSLDSMVLLIMKLDQLDKEIENALSSSLNSTPNLKRQIISVSGSLSASSQSLNTPLYRSSSSLSSSGPSGTAGARPKNEVS